jgi:hypothetical protein
LPYDSMMMIMMMMMMFALDVTKPSCQVDGWLMGEQFLDIFVTDVPSFFELMFHLTVKIVWYGKRRLNPSSCFGIDSAKPGWYFLLDYSRKKEKADY